jgi:hypothetical protein
LLYIQEWPAHARWRSRFAPVLDWRVFLDHLRAGVGLVAQDVQRRRPGAYVIALVTLAPAGLMLAGIIQMIRLQDELYQRIQFEAIAFAAILVWLVTLTWGFLETLALVRPLPAFGIASALVFFYGFGGWFFGKRYP